MPKQLLPWIAEWAFKVNFHIQINVTQEVLPLKVKLKWIWINIVLNNCKHLLVPCFIPMLEHTHPRHRHTHTLYISHTNTPIYTRFLCQPIGKGPISFYCEANMPFMFSALPQPFTSMCVCVYIYVCVSVNGLGSCGETVLWHGYLNFHIILHQHTSPFCGSYHHSASDIFMG